MTTTPIPPARVRGFNYSGSWGASGLDLWQHHDPGLMAIEVGRGVRYFPGWNVARWWLSHESFACDPGRFLADFEAGLALFDAHGISVIPVLFNRWRNSYCDFGGVWQDQLLREDEGFADIESDGGLPPWHTQPVFRRYLEAVVGEHRDDPRIYAWDLCNEPFFGRYMEHDDDPVLVAELRWLSWCAGVARRTGAVQATTIGNLGMLRALELAEPICDLLTFHPYYNPEHQSTEEFERDLDAIVAFAARSGKPLLATETVWGAIDDTERVRLLRYTLAELGKRDLGFVAHALHHSLVADLHSAEFGPVGAPGRLEFIEADGSLRAGHGAFNEY
jgi:hypothetical protein